MKFVAILLCIMLSFRCLSQNKSDSIYRLRVVAKQTVNKDKYNEYIQAEDMGAVNFFIVLHVKDNELKIFDYKTTIIRFTKYISSYNDSKGNEWVIYNGIDDDGRECLFRQRTNKTEETGFVYIDYPYQTYVYKVLLMVD